MAYNGGFDYGAGAGGASYGGFGGADPMGAFGGGEGGFVQGGSQGPSPSSKGKSKDRQTLIPVTIKQLKSATQDHPDDAWKVDGAELHQVKIVGNVLKVEEQSTFTKFDIEDSTGVIDVKLWLDNGDDEFMAERRNACREGTYVRVIGSVRSFQDTLHIVSHDTRPVADPNEITHHLLECVYQHCLRTKAPPAVQQQPAGWGAAPPQAPGMSAAMSMEGNANGFTPAQSRVLSFFSQNDSNDDEGTGLALDVVASSLRVEGISEKDVRAAVDFLANEGHLYSTIDDNHYKSTA